MLCIACDKHQREAFLYLTQTPGGLHPVQLPHFHIQKNQIQLSGMVLHPAQQSFSRGKFQDSVHVSMWL